MSEFNLPFPTFSPYRKHSLHYFLRGLDLLPNRLLHRWADQYGFPAEQYPTANAHMRLILGLTKRNKVGVTADNILIVRRNYHGGCFMLQAPYKRNPKQQRNMLVPDGADGANKARLYFPKPLEDGEDCEADTAVLFLHGGGFCIGDLETHDEYCREMASLTGWPVLAIDYRLAPEHPAPASLDDSLAAYRWMSANPLFAGKKIVICGDSAGACLAALAAQHIQHSRPDWPQPAAQLLWYPVTDIDGSRYPSRQKYGKDFALSQSDFDAFAAHFLRKNHIPNPIAWAPMQGEVQGIAPAFIVTAGLDMLHDEGAAYAEKLRNAGVPVKTLDVPGAPHGFLHLMSVHDETGTAVEHCLLALRQWVDSNSCSPAAMTTSNGA